MSYPNDQQPPMGGEREPDPHSVPWVSSSTEVRRQCSSIDTLSSSTDSLSSSTDSLSLRVQLLLALDSENSAELENSAEIRHCGCQTEVQPKRECNLSFSTPISVTIDPYPDEVAPRIYENFHEKLECDLVELGTKIKIIKDSAFEEIHNKDKRGHKGSCPFHDSAKFSECSLCMKKDEDEETCVDEKLPEFSATIHSPKQSGNLEENILPIRSNYLVHDTPILSTSSIISQKNLEFESAADVGFDVNTQDKNKENASHFLAIQGCSYIPPSKIDKNKNAESLMTENVSSVPGSNIDEQHSSVEIAEKDNDYILECQLVPDKNENSAIELLNKLSVSQNKEESLQTRSVSSSVFNYILDNVLTNTASEEFEGKGFAQSKCYDIMFKDGNMKILDSDKSPLFFRTFAVDPYRYRKKESVKPGKDYFMNRKAAVPKEIIPEKISSVEKETHDFKQHVTIKRDNSSQTNFQDLDLDDDLKNIRNKVHHIINEAIKDTTHGVFSVIRKKLMAVPFSVGWPNTSGYVGNTRRTKATRSQPYSYYDKHIVTRFKAKLRKQKADEEKLTRKLHGQLAKDFGKKLAKRVVEGRRVTYDFDDLVSLDKCNYSSSSSD